MPVFKTHRTAVLPETEIEVVKAETGKAQISNHKIVGRTKSHMPFPSPSSGEEAIYNYF